jgi:uncharacterized protein YraI
MKRITWITLLIGTLLLAACGAPRTEPVSVTTLPAAITQQANAPVTAPATAPAAAAAAAPTATVVMEVPVTAPTAAPTTASGPVASVTADGLNLRVGPGLNYRIASVLFQGEQVSLKGRSLDGEWINVRSSSGVDGWVFGSYLQSQTAFAGLPVLESYGGPAVDEPVEAKPIPARYTFDMDISGNVATVSLTGFPADTNLYLRLGVRGSGPSMTVASGKTSSDGKAVFTFAMPLTWPDGTPVTQSSLSLTAADDAGRLNRTINITYFSYSE